MLSYSMSRYKVEQGIPLPEKKEKWKRLIMEMGIGDSVLLENRSYAVSLYFAGLELGVKTKMAKDDKGIRVWRVS